MSLIEWDDSLSVGFEYLDMQHQRWIVIMNDLVDAVKQDEEATSIGNIVTELSRYTITHFNTEEQLMESYGFPLFDEHVLEHDEIKQTISRIKFQYDQGETVDAIELMIFLKQWLANHFLQTDKLLGSYLAEHQE